MARGADAVVVGSAIVERGAQQSRCRWQGDARHRRVRSTSLVAELAAGVRDGRRQAAEAMPMNWIIERRPPEDPQHRSIAGTCPRTCGSSARRPARSCFYKDVEANRFVIPGSSHHMRIGAERRACKAMFDDGTWLDIGVPDVRHDPLQASATTSATSTASRMRAPRPGCNDAIKVGARHARGHAGRRRACRTSTSWAARSAWRPARRSSAASIPRPQKGTPFILFAASGGARMQEGILSLMQMPRTTVAVQNAARGADCPISWC